MPDPPGHEQAWADALAQEHLHQRELLATLRDELGTFARECASALTALDAFVGLAGVTEILTTAQTTVAHAKLALEVGRRLRGAEDTQLVDLYEAVAGGEDVPPVLVRHASGLAAAGPRRTDRQLLEAVVTASGASGDIEKLVGPAPWAALAACKPLLRWVRPGDRSELLHSAAGDLAKVLAATAELGAGAEAEAASDAAALGDSLRESVEHIGQAAKAVREGRLESVLRESRERLQADLDTLRGIHENAHEAPQEWRTAREAEHAELTEEVRVKLEKVERIRGVLLRILPDLQAAVRALGVVQKLHALEGRLDPEPAAGAAAARSTVVVAAGSVLEALQPGAATAARIRIRRRTTSATTTLAAGTAIGPKPSMLPVAARFVEADRATIYTVSLEQGGEPVTAYRWSLTTPPGNPTCNRFAAVPGKPSEAVWHHADTDGCTHNGIQHDGTVHVTAVSAHWSCTESFFGTLTRRGAKNERCVRR